MERQLVTIRTITEISPIEGADFIEHVQVDHGWRCVAKKGEFSLNDPCVYIEVDSFIPLTDERFMFLSKNKIEYEGNEGVRIRTIKLKKKISQGIALPMIMFPEFDNLPEDTDFAGMLGIVKWESPAANNGGPNRARTKGNFPIFIPKSDQTRAQAFWNKIPRDVVYEVTIKIDGSSYTSYINDGKFGVCSRNLELKAPVEGEDIDPWWEMTTKYDIENKLRSLNKNVAIQGEVYGAKMNGNWESLTERFLAIYNVWDIDNQRWYSPEERIALCEALNIPHVPIIEYRKFDFNNIDEALEYAEGPSIKNKVREGVVFKSTDGDFSFKIISNTFLLKKGD